MKNYKELQTRRPGWETGTEHQHKSTAQGIYDTSCLFQAKLLLVLADKSKLYI